MKKQRVSWSKFLWLPLALRQREDSVEWPGKKSSRKPPPRHSTGGTGWAEGFANRKPEGTAW
uniref:Uncharacterized protein n=1 Tax=Anopheles atroparvus TaxID=41427 RepID=A0AAG5CT74_ANOAO